MIDYECISFNEAGTYTGSHYGMRDLTGALASAYEDVHRAFGASERVLIFRRTDRTSRCVGEVRRNETEPTVRLDVGVVIDTVPVRPAFEVVAQVMVSA